MEYKWISVSDKMPNNEVSVWLWDGIEVFEGFRERGDWLKESGGYCSTGIIAWYPLFAPSTD